LVFLIHTPSLVKASGARC